MRLADGTFARYYVAVAGSGQNAEVFTAPDKSPNSVKVEIMAKRLKKTIDTLYPGLEQKTRCNKREGTVTLDWIAVGRVVAVSKEAPVRVEWNLAACALHGIETEATRCKFEELTKTSPSSTAIEWSG